MFDAVEHSCTHWFSPDAVNFGEKSKRKMQLKSFSDAWSTLYCSTTKRCLLIIIYIQVICTVVFVNFVGRIEILDAWYVCFKGCNIPLYYLFMVLHSFSNHDIAPDMLFSFLYSLQNILFDQSRHFLKSQSFHYVVFIFRFQTLWFH